MKNQYLQQYLKKIPGALPGIYKNYRFAMKSGFIFFFSSKVNQKGNPVKFRSCTRSCKPITRFSEPKPLSQPTGRHRKPGKPEDLPVSLEFSLSGGMAELLCKIFQLLKFIYSDKLFMRNSLAFPCTLFCAVVLLLSCRKSGEERSQTADFESLAVPASGYWNGSDGTGFFTDSGLKFENQYAAAWQTWSGFSYSQKNDVTSSGFENQYSVMDPANLKNKFAIFYPSFGQDIFVSLNESGFFEPRSVALCNNTYSGLSMKNGDSWSKKFGGITGMDPDWFKVTVNGFDQNNNKSGSIDIYLADFRSSDSSKDYIVTKWTTFDLTALGKVYRLSFSFSSSDTGTYGINTPTYVCLDNLRFVDSQVIL